MMIFRFIARYAKLNTEEEEARQFLSALKFSLTAGVYEKMMPNLKKVMKDTWPLLEKYNITHS